MCWIAQYTIGNDPQWLPLMQPGSKMGLLQSLPLGITSSSVFQYIGIHIQNFKILHIYPMFNYLLELLGPSPSASMSLSCWFSAFGSSLILGTFLYLEHLSRIFLGLGNSLKKTSSQVQQLSVGCHDQCALLDFTFLTCGMHHWNSIRPSII